MKRLKSAVLLVISIALCLSITLSSFSVSAFAQADFNGQFFAGNMITRVKEGADFSVPTPNEGVTLEVTTPSGQKATPKSENTYRATQLGNYKVTYKAEDGKNKYSYNVLCYEEREYSIKVTETAEDFIPSLVAVGKKLKMPKFELVYSNAKGETTVLPTTMDVTKGIQYDTDMATLSTEDGDIYLNVENAGTLNITFWAKTGVDTTKKFVKEYTVKVQENFEDTIAPVLNTLSLSPTANINALYTLPMATATDHHEKNVFIEVNVIGPDGEPVLDYKANDYGYADTSVEPTERVMFDNKEVRSFYPVEEGSYKITYVAIDGSGNRSITHEYTVECRDRLAPKIEEFASDLIPTKWGLEVYKGDGADEPSAVGVDASFKLPMPLAVDNATPSDELEMTLTIKNPASRNVARWQGKVSEFLGEGVKVESSFNTYLKAENEDYILKAQNGVMDFSFDLFNFDNDRINKDSEKFGDWTIEYSFKDAANNGGTGNARKIATINLSKSFTDLKAPEIDENNLDIPKYVLINDENDSFTVPVVPLLSDDDTELTINYTMKSPANLGGRNTVTYEGVEYTVINLHKVKGGEEYAIQNIGGDYYMLISEDNKDYAFLLEGSLVTLEFFALDDVGNNSEHKIINIDILYAGSIEQDIFLAASDADQQATAPDFDLSDGKQKEEKVLGGFVIQNVMHIDYTGFELSIVDADGQPVEFKVYTYNRKNVGLDEQPEEDIYTIYVDDITVTPKKEGIYTVNIRVYDISGKSAAYGYSFNVQKSGSQGGVIGQSAARIEGTGTLRTEYQLEKTFAVQDINVENVVVREINGFGFGIMNSIFIGLDTATYRIRDYVIEDYSPDWTEDDLDLRSSYNVLIEDKEKPVIEIHDIIPKYISETTPEPEVPGEYEEGAYVELPVITAYTKFENADIEVRVEFEGEKVDSYKIYTGPNGKTFKAKETVAGEEVENRFTGVFAFAAEKEGEYRITITATTSSGETANIDRTVIVGDRTPASFTVSPIKTATVGSKYVIAVPTVEGNITKIEVTLRGPDNSIINEASVSYTSISDLERNKETTYKFADAGIYTVTYTITNSNNIESSDTFEIEVSDTGSTPRNNPAPIATVVIIVGILLIIGVIIYMVRFRAVKK